MLDNYRNQFQAFGALTENALSPKLLVCDRGTANRFIFPDLSERVGEYELISSDMYSGAVPCNIR